MTTTAGSQPSRRAFKGPRAIIAVLAAILVLVLAGLVGAELYARHRAASLVADAVQCEVRDTARVSFSTTPPVLAQYLSGHYQNISVQTAGHQVRDAKGMTIDLDIRDVRLQHSGDSKGTIGSLDGAITWSSDGIKQSIQDAIPMLGNIITGSVTTNPGDGTVELQGLLDSTTVKPQIVDNGLSLQLVSLSALGRRLPTDHLQHSLDELTAHATKNYPLAMHADSVQVTDNGVVTKFSSQNANIPAGGTNPCFADL